MIECLEPMYVVLSSNLSVSVAVLNQTTAETLALSYRGATPIGLLYSAFALVVSSLQSKMFDPQVGLAYSVKA